MGKQCVHLSNYSLSLTHPSVCQPCCTRWGSSESSSAEQCHAEEAQLSGKWTTVCNSHDHIEPTAGVNVAAYAGSALVTCHVHSYLPYHTGVDPK
jgi:hypothetical protein